MVQIILVTIPSTQQNFQDFISHMVQIILTSIETIASWVKSFISHMVQIILASTGKNHKCR